MRFDNKIAIIAGGARDIGRAVSEKLAAEGAKVVVNFCNSEEGAHATVEGIRSAGGAAVAVKGDMTVAADVANVVQVAQANYGNAIDVLVNVVGGLVARKSLLEMDESFLEHVMRLNVTSTFLTTKAVIPHMGDGGAIINFASQAGRDGGGSGAAAYGASKAAVIGFTRAIAKEFGPANIRVNCVCPGMISTTFHDTFTQDEVRANVAAGTALRREGQTSEVADLVAYLASSESSFINGASVDINGGTVFS